MALHENVIQKIIISKIESIQLITNINFIRIDDIAEILFWLIFVIFAILILSTGFLSKIKDIRQFMYINIFYFFLIAIPGIFLDVLSVNIIQFFNLSETFLFITQLIFNTVEEFGEILFISLAFAYFFKNTNHILNNRYTRKIINK